MVIFSYYYYYRCYFYSSYSEMRINERSELSVLLNFEKDEIRSYAKKLIKDDSEDRCDLDSLKHSPFCF